MANALLAVVDYPQALRAGRIGQAFIEAAHGQHDLDPRGLELMQPFLAACSAIDACILTVGLFLALYIAFTVAIR